MQKKISLFRHLTEVEVGTVVELKKVWTVVEVVVGLCSNKFSFLFLLLTDRVCPSVANYLGKAL